MDIAILLIALGLAIDSFSVSIANGLATKTFKISKALTIALFFGLFQGLMPIFGWLAGESIADYISAFDHWVAFGLLVIVGSRMLWESFRPEHGQGKELDITKGLLLITLSVATSIDSLAVGLSFAFLTVNIVTASLTIGAVAFLVTEIGFAVGKRANKMIGKRAEAIGGIILLAIGLRILLSHLL